MSLLVARRGLLAAGVAAEAPAPSGNYADEVAADNPDWWLRLEETSGTAAADEVGTNDGAVTGANLGVASFGDTGSAASFDGTDDRIVVPHDALLNAGDLFTFECLVKIDNPTANSLQTIADKTGLSSANAQWGLWWDNRSSQGSPLRLRFNCGDGPSVNGSKPSIVADYQGTAARDAIGAGIHIVGTYDRTASVSVRLYVNGSEVAVSDSSSSNTVNGSNTRDVDIARGAGQFYLGGILDELAIYSKLLSTARISAHASAAGLGS